MSGRPPFPPGTYPLLLVGSGPGGLQTAYLLRRMGIGYAHLSADPAPGGMFRRLPVFDHLLSWSKPPPPAGVPGRGEEWADWNALVADPADRVRVREFMDGSSVFPTRAEMERALVAFADRNRLPVRHDAPVVAAEPTEDGFEVVTGDGVYRTGVLVLATGMATPWRPSFPGVELASDYADLEGPGSGDSARSRVNRSRVARYRGRRVLVIGKQNSGFEVATQLLPVAAQVIVVGPGPTRFTVTTHSFAGARARFDQPFEDHVVGGGTSVLEAAVVSVRRAPGGLEVELRMSADGSPFSVEVDDVITATGFTADFGPFAGLGLDRFARGTLPRQSPYWESTSTPGVFFAGTLGQGARGLRRYGVPGTSASIQGFRYNAVVQTRHLARTRFGVAGRARPVDDPSRFLQDALASSPELMSQKGYLARIITFGDDGPTDGGLEPLDAFVNGSGDAVAATIEAGPDGEIHPALHVRTAGGVTEHLLDPHPLHRFDGPEYRRQVGAVVKSSGLGSTRRTVTAAT